MRTTSISAWSCCKEESQATLWWKGEDPLTSESLLTWRRMCSVRYNIAMGKISSTETSSQQIWWSMTLGRPNLLTLGWRCPRARRNHFWTRWAVLLYLWRRKCWLVITGSQAIFGHLPRHCFIWDPLNFPLISLAKRLSMTWLKRSRKMSQIIQSISQVSLLVFWNKCCKRIRLIEYLSKKFQSMLGF